MSLKAAIFDLDGTLLNSTGLWRFIDRQFLGKRGFAVPPDYEEAIGVMSMRECALYTVKRFGLRDTAEDLIREWRDMALREYRYNLPLNKGAAELLHALASRGVKIALATATESEFYTPALRRCGVYEYFSAFFDAERGFRKGSPEFYLTCAEELGVAPRCCVVFDDTAAALAAASRAGMMTVAVLDGVDPARGGEIFGDIPCVSCFDEFLPMLDRFPD